MGRQLQALTLLWITLVLAGCAGIQPNQEAPTVDVVGVRIDPQSQGTVPRFLISLRVLNPNRQTLALSGMSYHLYLQDQRILSGVSNNLPQIPGYEEATLEVGATPALFGSVRLLQELASTPGLQELNYRVEVKLDSGGISWPINVEREGKLSLRP